MCKKKIPCTSPQEGSHFRQCGISGCTLWALAGLCVRDIEIEGEKGIKCTRVVVLPVDLEHLFGDFGKSRYEYWTAGENDGVTQIR